MKNVTKKEKIKENDKPLYPYLIFLLIVIMLMFLAFYFWTALNSSHIPPLKYISQKDDTKDELVEEGFEQYKNYSVDFQFIYPETWVLVEGHNSVIVSSDKEYPKSYIEAENPEMKDSDIYIQIHFSNLPVDISREIPNYTKASWSKLTIAGVPAKKITYAGTDKFAEYIPNFLLGDFYFLISVDSMDSNETLIAGYNKLIDSFGAVERNSGQE